MIAVNVSSSQIDYGNLELSPADNDRMHAESEAITATNVGNVPIDMTIYGSNATPANGDDEIWTLDCSSATGVVGDNQFVHRFSKATGPVWNSSDSNTLCPSSSQAKSLASNLLAGTGAVDFRLRLDMPTSSTGYSQRSTTVTIVAAAH